ncbi:plastid division protein PDV2-like [Impatiens glandulifera]|uniref:plastid division protein PDV2-like n=1 Tax=Impatiens glandulifera TaxID=253017 RepID=UPI001FB05DDE|nr:plastid division protein PDV2-like [Impatiens glandulifera]
MDEDGIELALARASELRAKITNCIHKASANQTLNSLQEGQDRENVDTYGIRSNGTQAEDEEEEEEEAAVESLLNIRDALESLEGQLTSLQALQQQQCYERETGLSEIELSRKKLLKKLQEYKGKDYQVIYDATAFASETVEVANNDLLLPPYGPYPSRPPPPRPSSLSVSRKFEQHPTTSDGKKCRVESSSEEGEEEKKEKSECEEGNKKQALKGLKYLINAGTKTMLMVVGVVFALHLTGFEPRVVRKKKRDKQEAFNNVFGIIEKERMITQCPAGKVLVVEDGESRCVVKERVEIPFEAVVVVAKPDVSFGCG